MSTRDSIMDAAEEIFVNSGFSGSSMKSIAERAAVAKSLLYHYFASKRELWDEVIHRRVSQAKLPQRMIEMVSSIASDGLEAVRTKKNHTTYFEFLRDNPQFVRMLAWLNAEQSLWICPPPEVRSEIIGTLKELQKKGVFRDDIDPRMFVICFMSLCEMWFISRNRISAWFGEDMSEDEMSKEYIDSIGKILLEGMTGSK
ncbi:MAG: TetR/AcrR family transcriptional regulator [Candidatus Aegiribacteria sp.]|nr:TetR/AcrR family transcriptional regulator [Candidatus Aegiribacteria sp.]